MDELSQSKKLDQKQINDIKYVRNKKKQKLTDDELAQMIPKPKTKEEVEEDVKHKLKFAWKGKQFFISPIFYQASGAAATMKKYISSANEALSM